MESRESLGSTVYVGENTLPFIPFSSPFATFVSYPSASNITVAEVSAKHCVDVTVPLNGCFICKKIFYLFLGLFFVYK
jgi:hypothetical protein